MRLVDSCLSGDVVGRGLVVAGQHHGGHAQRVQLGNGLAGTVLDGVGHGKKGQHLGLAGQQGHRAALGLLFSQHRLQGRAAQSSFFHEPVVPQYQGLAVQLGGNTAPGKGREAGHGALLARSQALGDGFGHGVVRVPSQVRGPAQNPGLGMVVGQRLPGHQPRLAFGDRAGLIECDGLELVRVLQIHPTLDENAAPRRKSQATDHRHRRGDHQRTRACNDQQHQGLVERVRPRQVHDDRGEHRHQHRDEEHGGGVDGGKPVHELLRGCARALRLFHRMDDAGQGGVAGLCRHHHLQHARFVDGAGKHRVTRCLVHRNALARDGRLVDRAGATGHYAVQRHALAGFDAQEGVHRNLRRCHRCPAPVRLAHLGRFGRKVQQALDGIARPVHRAALDQFGNGVKGHDHGGLGPLTNEKSAGHGHRHQRVDVQPPLQQGGKPLAIGGKARQPDGGGRQRHAHPLENRRVRGQKGHGLSSNGQTQRQSQASQALCAGFVSMVIARFPGSHGLRVKPGLADRGQGLGDHIVGCVNGESACAELKTQPAHPGNGFQRPADLAFFCGAVHGGNPEHGARCAMPIGGRRRCGYFQCGGTAGIDVVDVGFLRFVAAGWHSFSP